MNKLKLLHGALSPYENYCDGFGSPGATGNSYLLGVVLGVGKDKIQYSHPGSNILDKINVFDLAEVEGAYIGQLNMSIVSSFCGPQGLIWGYDIAAARYQEELKLDQELTNIHNERVAVYSAWPLIEATQSLFGTRDHKLFPLRPGAHVPFAGKNFTFEGPKIVYSGIGLGIPEDRDLNAVLLMEDMGWIPPMGSKENFAKYKSMLLSYLSQSVIKVGENQKVAYREIYVAVKALTVQVGEIGCALVAAPYFTLAKNAYVADLDRITISEWQQSVSK